MLPPVDMLGKVKALPAKDGKAVKITRQTSLSKKDDKSFNLTGAHHGVNFNFASGAVSVWKTEIVRMNAALYIANNLWKIPYEKRDVLKTTTMKGVVDAMLALGISDKKLGFVSTVAKKANPVAAKAKTATAKAPSKKATSPSDQELDSTDEFGDEEDDAADDEADESED